MLALTIFLSLLALVAWGMFRNKDAPNHSPVDVIWVRRALALIAGVLLAPPLVLLGDAVFDSHPEVIPLAVVLVAGLKRWDWFAVGILIGFPIWVFLALLAIQEAFEASGCCG